MTYIIVCEDNDYEIESYNDYFKIWFKNRDDFRFFYVANLFQLDECLEEDVLLSEKNRLCLIMDMNMSPSGLKDIEVPPVEIKYTGWYWFLANADKFIKYSKQFSVSIIFYSAFSKEFFQSQHAIELKSYDCLRIRFIKKNNEEALQEALNQLLP